MGFEPTRAEPIGLAVQRLNHSATSSSYPSLTFLFNILSAIPILSKFIFQTPVLYVTKKQRGTKILPTPGVEPGPSGWKPDILAVRPRGIMFPSGIEPETFCVLGRCDNRYTTETCSLHVVEAGFSFLADDLQSVVSDPDINNLWCL